MNEPHAGGPKVISEADREGLAAFLLRMRAKGFNNKALFSAMEMVPRRKFVDPQYHHAVFGPRTIPIACGETLEAIDLEAQMLDALGLENGHRVFEIGTGTGFTACVMSKMAKSVHTTERFRTLNRFALDMTRELQIANVVATQEDGSAGSAEGPFDRIIAWGAFDSLPRTFSDQLTSGGVMVCAIGEADETQALVRLTKTGSRFEREDIGTVRFQPLVRGLPATL